LTALVAVLALLVAAAAVQGAPRAGSDPVQVTALAVSDDGQGTFVGVHAIVEAQVLSGGAGRVYVATKPLAQTDMQGSARLASRVAANLLGAKWDDYDYLVSFRSDSTVIGGPSAGAVMALAITTALHNVRDPDNAWSLDPTVAGTGTINADGTIGPVGGIPAKAEGAKEAGIQTFLYPAGLDIATTQVQGRTVSVDMKAHCAKLGLTCRPAASLLDVLRAAGVQVEQPAAPVPGTTDYAKDLQPTVEAQVQALSDRIARFDADPRLAHLSAAESSRAEQEKGVASERLGAARDALAAQKYYLAATRSFQGSIQAGRAENLTAFYDAGHTSRPAQDAVVQQAIDGCAAAAGAASNASDPLRASGITALYAVASAQQRAAQARDLLAQARQLHDGAVRLEDWVQSMFASTFCVERAGTASWWSDLRTTFGAGPSLGDRAALVDDTLEVAQEEVAYAEAVLGTDLVADASAHLAAAQQHDAAGRSDAAVLEAIEAQTSAGVAMQTAGTQQVPQAVLDAAEQSAARAIDTARSAGIEPMLSVSLVELSQDQNQTDQALANLWDARSLALLEGGSTPATFGGSTHAPSGTYGRDAVSASLAMGIVVGGSSIAILVTAVLLARRR
jgi:uncharacterized protein